MFLTEEELRELTGYIYHCRQIEWLRRHNWKFEVTAQRRPKVARSYFNIADRLGDVIIIFCQVARYFIKIADGLRHQAGFCIEQFLQIC